MTSEKKSRRGFAAMTPERQREIARAGGRAAHAKGTAHQFTPEEAREAGRKGGLSASRDREHMSRIGHKGVVATGRATSRAKDLETRLDEALRDEPPTSGPLPEDIEEAD